MAVFNFTEMTFTLCILTWSVHTEPGAGNSRRRVFVRIWSLHA
ncbi:hypothetical protein HMPREF1545_00471 [Oscillibacter sp. KLE 1728]|nr:hypothetical protein HMPREF1545_00471 [Oscillibacter sp. KLE 1728]